jgi:hypothetical protein
MTTVSHWRSLRRSGFKIVDSLLTLHYTTNILIKFTPLPLPPTTTYRRLNMANNYGKIPESALHKPKPFKIEIPAQELDDLKTLLRLSKIPAPTYESLQEDGKFGVSHKWLTESKKYWEEKFDWYVPWLYFGDRILTEFRLGDGANRK